MTPEPILARLNLLAELIAAHGFRVQAVRGGGRSLCGRGDVVAHLLQGEAVAGQLVAYQGERLAFSRMTAQAEAATMAVIKSAAWLTRFGPMVPAPPTPARANLSAQARRYLSEIGAPDPDATVEAAGLIWQHALAIGYSPAYLAENAEFVKGDWPRVPLPAALDDLLASATLGRRVAALLDDPHAPTPEVPAHVGALTATGPDLYGHEVRGGWGSTQRGGVVMPGRGTLTERAAAGLPEGLGTRVVDVVLNSGWAWTDIPLTVWEWRIGGYQVVKKWLSYREYAVLGRALHPSEVAEVTSIVRRLCALALLSPALDASYRRCAAATWRWQAERPEPPAPAGKPEVPQRAETVERACDPERLITIGVVQKGIGRLEVADA